MWKESAKVDIIFRVLRFALGRGKGSGLPVVGDAVYDIMPDSSVRSTKAEEEQAEHDNRCEHVNVAFACLWLLGLVS